HPQIVRPIGYPIRGLVGEFRVIDAFVRQRSHVLHIEPALFQVVLQLPLQVEARVVTTEQYAHCHAQRYPAFFSASRSHRSIVRSAVFPCIKGDNLLRSSQYPVAITDGGVPATHLIVEFLTSNTHWKPTSFVPSFALNDRSPVT